MNPELNISGTQKRMNKPENRFVWRSSPSLKGEVSGANRGMYTPPLKGRLSHFSKTIFLYKYFVDLNIFSL